MAPSIIDIPDSPNQVHSRNTLSFQSPSHNAANWGTLYPELIYEILTYCLSGVTLSTGAALGSFPWYLGQICRLWRLVFISSPLFWDRFTFEAVDQMEMATIDHCERALAVVKLCIERTKDRPFSFELREQLSLDEEQSPRLHRGLFRILETLVPHADRWRVVCFQVADADRLKRSLTKAQHRFGQLHSLQIRTGWVLNRRIPSDVFQDAPNLTRVYTTDYYQLPPSITILHIDGAHTPHIFFPNFDKMTCLEELVIRASGFDHDAANYGPVELPSLKKISVDNFSLLSFIKAPALETLSLDGATSYDDNDILAAEALLRGVSHLKTLSFDISHDGAERIIDYTPELDHLIITCIVLEALRSLFQSLASRSTAHSLRRINVGVGHLRYSVAPFMDVLAVVIKSWEKRQFPKLCLVSVHINDDLKEEDITSAIVDLTRVGRHKGVEIEVKFSPLPEI